jgi:hypothetical protein
MEVQPDVVPLVKYMYIVSHVVSPFHTAVMHQAWQPSPRPMVVSLCVLFQYKITSTVPLEISYMYLRAADAPFLAVVEALKGQSSVILIWFVTYIDRPRPENEPLLILKIFRDPHKLITKTTLFTRFRRNHFGKIILIAEIFSEYFSYTINLFWKPIS